MKAAVFVSGSGTNLEALLEREKAGDLQVEIAGVISDKPDAYALTRAKNHGVESAVFIQKEYGSKEAFETAISAWLKERNIELIILAGYMRYIGTVLLEGWPEAIVNLHPAYLPEFPGAHGIADAWHAGVTQTGVTVHYVDEGVDTGPVIVQKRVPIRPGCSLEELEADVHAMEYQLFWQGVNMAANTLKESKAGAAAPSSNTQ